MKVRVGDKIYDALTEPFVILIENEADEAVIERMLHGGIPWALGIFPNNTSQGEMDSYIKDTLNNLKSSNDEDYEDYKSKEEEVEKEVSIECNSDCKNCYKKNNCPAADLD